MKNKKQWDKKRAMVHLIDMPIRTLDRARILLKNKLDHDYITNKLASRKGKCNGCGECCPQFCPHLDKRGRCRIYKKRYKHCIQWPVDDTSIALYDVRDKCDYYWGKKNE